jgi:hypothetical protein
MTRSDADAKLILTNHYKIHYDAVSLYLSRDPSH